MSLGTLVVDLLARTGSFETDLNRAGKLAAKRAKEIDAQFKAAGKAIGLALAAGIIGITAAIKSTINHMDELSKAAQKVGLPTEDFSKLTYAASLADVSMETLVSSLGKLTKSQAAALNTTSQQAKVFGALGISIKDASGHLRESDDVLADFADRFKALGGSPEAMAAGFALFGRSFQEMIPLLKDGGDGIRDAGDELERLGGVLSTKAGQQAEQFNDNLTRLKVAAKGLFQQVASELLPKLVELTDDFVALVSKGDLAHDMAVTLGAAFSVSAGAIDAYAKSVRITTVALEYMAKAALALREIQLNIQTFGMADGTVADGVSRLRAATAAGDAELREIHKQREKPKQAIRIITADSGSLPESVFRNPTGDSKEVQALKDALAAALAGGEKKGPKAKKEGKSDAEREAEQLQQAYSDLIAQQKERLALIGKEGEEAHAIYDTQFGDLSKLTQAQKDQVVANAQKIDQLTAEREAQEELDRINKQHQETVQQTLDDIAFETKLLGLSNVEREKEIALRYANAKAGTAEGDAIAAAIQQRHDEAEAMNTQIGLMDTFRQGAADALTDFVTGAKSAKDALKDFFDSLAAAVTQAIANQWIKQLFGEQGQSGGGSSGDLLGSIFGLFGGGKASGGPAMAGGSYLVGERGPELFVPRTSGTVVPHHETARAMGGGAPSITQQFFSQERITARNARQMQQEAAIKQRTSLGRNS